MLMIELIQLGLSANQISKLTNLTSRQVRKFRAGKKPMPTVTDPETNITKDVDFDVNISMMDAFAISNRRERAIQQARDDMYDAYKSVNNQQARVIELNADYDLLYQEMKREGEAIVEQDKTYIAILESHVAEAEILLDRLQTKFRYLWSAAQKLGVTWVPPHMYHQGLKKQKERVRSRKAAKSLWEDPTESQLREAVA